MNGSGNLITESARNSIYLSYVPFAAQNVCWGKENLK
jgi:hypothetical protein